MKKSLEQVRDEFCAAVRREMANENYNFLPLDLSYFKYEYGIEPKLIGRLLGKFRRSLSDAMPEFTLEYKPGWDFNLIIRRR